MKRLGIVITHAVVIILVIAIVGTIGLLSSAEESEGSEKFTGELEEGAVIRVLENDTAISQGYLDELLAAFNEAYAEYNITAVDANMGNYIDLANAGPYGYGPDVLYQANDQLMQYVSGKHILPLSVEDLDCYEYISDEAWLAYTADYEGETYIFGVPVNIQQPLLYYRTDMLPDNWEEEWDKDGDGICDVLQYWNALYAYSKQIVESNSSASTVEDRRYGYMKSLNDGYFALGYIISYGGYVFGGEYKDDTYDIGLAEGDSWLGLQVIRQLASVMNSEAQDDSITTNAYSRLANGTYFATMTTPDVYTTFINQIMIANNCTEEEAEELLGVVDVPMLPVSGNLEDSYEDTEFFEMTVMGGVNGYAISSYTKYPNAALAFVNFATSYKMIKLRSDLLGITPARSDVVEELDELDQQVHENLESGRIYVMPSVSELSQVWTPFQTLCASIVADSLSNGTTYVTEEQLRTALESVVQQIYDAIHILAGG